jgi:hypothetical protein
MMQYIQRIIRGIISLNILMLMVLFPACNNPLDQGTGAKPVIGEDVSQNEHSQNEHSQNEHSQNEHSLGRVWLRFAAGKTEQRNLYPEIETFSQYVLSFTHEDGGTAPDAVIAGEDHLSVDLKAGIWNITARGFADGEGGALIAAAQGRVDIAVEAGKEAQAIIVLDTIIPGEGIPGIFSYGVEFPRELVSSAVMELSIPGAGETYIPYTAIDLGEEGKQAASVSLPAGYYRMDIRLGTIFPVIRKTEIIHIYPAMETKAPLYRFDEAEFPEVTELEDIAALESYLAEQPENTEATPYLIKLSGFNLTGGASPVDNLNALYKALVRYTALDLRDCTGESVPKSSLKTTDHKKNLVSLILPKTVRTIEAGAFNGYEALVHLEAPGLDAIEKETFKDCAKLESIYMPLVETIEDAADVNKGAFRNCESLYWVFLPRASFIGNYAFYNCKALETVFLPKGITIGANAFKSCGGLISASLPQAESIGDSAFHGCKSFINVMLGEDPPDLANQAFTASRLPYVYVPAAGMENYKETEKENWTAALKAKLRSLPE